MTENEAIKLHIAENLHRIKVIEEFLRTNSDADDKECRKNIQILTKTNDVLRALQELKQYRAIDTVEECREAREKQRGKKPILCMNEVSGMFIDYTDGHGEYKTQMNNWWHCPCCNEVVGQRVIVHKHIHDQRKKNYCENCGQAIDWSELGTKREE